MSPNIGSGLEDNMGSFDRGCLEIPNLKWNHKLITLFIQVVMMIMKLIVVLKLRPLIAHSLNPPLQIPMLLILSCIHSYLVAAYLIGILLLTPSPIVKAYLLAWMKMLTQILTSLTHRLLTPLIIMWKMTLLN